MTYDDAFQLTGAYALDALTPEEAAAVEAAIAESEELRGEVAELTDTAVQLGLAVPAVTPPADLRDRILALVETTPQLPAEGVDEGAAGASIEADAGAADATADEEDPRRVAVPAVLPADEPVAPVPATGAVPVIGTTQGSGTSHVAPRRRRRIRGRSRLVSLLAGSVAAVLLAFGGGIAFDRALRAGELDAEAAFVALNEAPDVRTASVAISDGGSARVVWSPSQREAAVVLSGADVPDDRVLQLWRIRGSSVSSAGLFEPSAGQAFEMLDGGLQPGTTFAVSVEPNGGSEQPTTDPIAAILIPS